MDVKNQGYSQPVAGSTYPEGPYYFRGSRLMYCLYEADTDAVVALLPDEVSPLHDPIRCALWASANPFTTVGRFHEVTFLVQVEYDGFSYAYCPFIYVDNEVTLAAGREVWGLGKKLATMSMTMEAENLLFTLERPTGKRLMTMTVAPERPASPEDLGGFPILGVVKFPSLEDGQPPFQQMVRTGPELAFHSTALGQPDLWAGRCSVTMDSPSANDPVDVLAPTKILGGYCGTYDMVAPHGTPVKTF